MATLSVSGHQRESAGLVSGEALACQRPPLRRVSWDFTTWPVHLLFNSRPPFDRAQGWASSPNGVNLADRDGDHQLHQATPLVSRPCGARWAASA